MQKFTNFHTIRSWSFQNICNEIGWHRFFAPPYVYISSCLIAKDALTTCRTCTNGDDDEDDDDDDDDGTGINFLLLK